MPLVLGAPILVLASLGSDDARQGAASEGGERAQGLRERTGEGTWLTKGDPPSGNLQSRTLTRSWRPSLAECLSMFHHSQRDTMLATNVESFFSKNVQAPGTERNSPHKERALVAPTRFGPEHSLYRMVQGKPLPYN